MIGIGFLTVYNYQVRILHLIALARFDTKQQPTIHGVIPIEPNLGEPIWSWRFLLTPPMRLHAEDKPSRVICYWMESTTEFPTR